MNIVLFYDRKDHPIALQILEMLEPDISRSEITVRTPEHINKDKPLNEEIDKLMSDCAIVVLLASAQVFTHPAYEKVESIVIDRFNKHEIQFYPIMVRHCLWGESGLSNLNTRVHPTAENWLSKFTESDQKYFLQDLSLVLSGQFDAMQQLILEVTNSMSLIKNELGNNNLELLTFEKQLEKLEKDKISGTNSRSELFIKSNRLFQEVNHFLNTTRNTTSTTTDQKVNGILYLYANPKRREAALFERELKEMDKVIEPYKEKIPLIKRSNVEATELLRELTRVPAKVVHISVHGTFEGELEFVDEDNNADGITVDRLFRIFSQLKTRNQLPELVLINACHSKEHAQRLADLGPTTIGMDGAIPVTAAVKFAEIFYLNYLAGGSIQFSFDEAVFAIEKLNIETIPKSDPHEMPQIFNQKTN